MVSGFLAVAAVSFVGYAFNKPCASPQGRAIGYTGCFNLAEWVASVFAIMAAFASIGFIEHATTAAIRSAAMKHSRLEGISSVVLLGLLCLAAALGALLLLAKPWETYQTYDDGRTKSVDEWTIDVWMVFLGYSAVFAFGPLALALVLVLQNVLHPWQWEPAEASDVETNSEGTGNFELEGSSGSTSSASATPVSTTRIATSRCLRLVVILVFLWACFLFTAAMTPIWNFSMNSYFKSVSKYAMFYWPVGQLPCSILGGSGEANCVGHGLCREISHWLPGFQVGVDACPWFSFKPFPDCALYYGFLTLFVLCGALAHTACRAIGGALLARVTAKGQVPEYPLQGSLPTVVCRQPDAVFVALGRPGFVRERFFVESVLSSFAEYRRVPGQSLLRRGGRSLPSLMEFSALTPATGGQVEILEFLWPPLADADGQRACVCYVLMLRTDGFLLCVPGPFFSASELAPDGDDGAVRPGPSFQLTAPAVALSEEGEWILAPSTNPIAVTVVDFAASALGEGAGASTDYQTGVSDPGGPQAEVRRQRPKRPTVALLAQQQASLTEVVARLSDQLAKFQQAPSAVQPPRADPTPQPALSSAEARRHLCSRGRGAQARESMAQSVSFFQSVPKSLAHALGPPPPARALLPAQGPADVDQDARLAAAITAGELPDVPAQPDLTSAMMAQSQALLTLVGHLARGADPVLDNQGTAATSSRGSQTRQRLQAELASHSGAFAEKVKERALLSMSPAGVGSTEPFSLCRYYERYGGFERHRELALVAWQVAISFDLMMAGNSNGAADVLALLAVYLDQLVLDQGATTVAWLLTLQQDPPQVLYSAPAQAPGTGVQPFSPLADQKWITSALGYLREMDLIASRRAEAKPKPKRPPGLPQAPTVPTSTQEDAALTKKQLRAAQWAAKRATAGAPPAKRGTHLAARFGELTDFLLACGVGPDAYDGAVHEAVLRRPLVPHAPGGPDCLRPYRPLEADGIVLHGEANWDISPYLPPGMLLAYRDPLVLETFPGTGGPSPSFQHEDPGEVLKLMKVWDSKGLLSLRPGGLSDIRCSRVFGAYKGPSKFRQIGDRRGPNSLEARLDGVSHLLPQGFLLTRLHVPRFTHQLLGSSTDRKDFYSQCKVPLERAFSNAVKPGFSLGDFANTRAHRAYVDWVLSEAGKEHCRRYLPPGDFSSVAVRRSALLCPSVPVHGCFNSLFQGDAAGVELATAAHAAFLEEARVLPSWEGGRVLAKHPVHPTGPWSGVVIDDLFCISCEPADLPDHLACDSARVIGLSKEAYARAGVRGSDDKDV
ncbi:unnamed protein product [Symbiodinium microadriaticum]|nr:unnamed protein product [Symbiodinium microadriaticum]